MKKQILSLAILVAPTLSFGFDKDDSETVVRQMMCATPKHYYGTKANLKRELNTILQDALRFEGLKSISELADRAGNKSGLRYATRSILAEAVFLAAITENRSALVDLTRMENNLCKRQSNVELSKLWGKKESAAPTSKGCERLTSALSNPETFMKNVKDQYDFIQDERFRTPKVKAEPKTIEKPTASELLSAAQIASEMESYKKSNRYVMNTGSFPEIPDIGKLTEKIDNAPDHGRMCAEKIPGALKASFESYNPNGNVVVVKNPDDEGRAKLQNENSGFSPKLPKAGQR